VQKHSLSGLILSCQLVGRLWPSLGFTVQSLSSAGNLSKLLPMTVNTDFQRDSINLLIL